MHFPSNLSKCCVNVANERQDFSSLISIKRKIFFSSCLFKNLVFKLFKSSIIQRKTKLGTSITSNFSVVFVCVRGGGIEYYEISKTKTKRKYYRHNNSVTISSFKSFSSSFTTNHILLNHHMITTGDL